MKVPEEGPRDGSGCTCGGRQTARLLRASEVAQLLDIPEGTLSNWRYEGRGPEYVKIGRAVRYPEDKLRRFLDRHTVKPTRVSTP